MANSNYHFKFGTSQKYYLSKISNKSNIKLMRFYCILCFLTYILWIEYVSLEDYDGPTSLIIGLKFTNLEPNFNWVKSI